jgi:hypothetical protein
MGTREAVWTLLNSRLGDWVTRAEIDFVGGAEGTRRLRELRTFVAGTGMTIENRVRYHDGQRQEEYRLVRYVEPDPVAGRWVCTKCGAPPTGVTTNSMDPRWRLGHCFPCKIKQATFEKVMT